MSTDRPHVLLVDDDPDVHHAVRLVLESAGFRATCVLTGKEAEDVLARDPPHAILLDIMLATPTEGLDLAAKWRASGAADGVPILVLSSIGSDVGTQLAREHGLDASRIAGFLAKPFAASTLLAEVGRALRAAG